MGVYGLLWTNLSHRFWGLRSLHNIYGVLPLGAGTSSGGPEGRSCEFSKIVET